MNSHLINYSDLFNIISNAKTNMSRMSLPLHVSLKEIGQRELPTVAITEAVLMYLNSKGLLVKNVKIDYNVIYDDNDMPDLEPSEPSE